MLADADKLTDEQIRRYATPAGAQVMRLEAEVNILELLRALETATGGKVGSVLLTHKPAGHSEGPLKLTAVKLKLEV